MEARVDQFGMALLYPLQKPSRQVSLNSLQSPILILYTTRNMYLMSESSVSSPTNNGGIMHVLSATDMLYLKATYTGAVFGNVLAQEVVQDTG